MRQVAPSLLWITMHDIDIAHAGAYSLYIEGIRRTDRSVPKSGKPSEPSRNTPERPQCLSCRISAAIPTTTPAETDSSITAPATRSPAQRG